MKTDTEILQLLQSHQFERARHASMQRLRSNKLDAQAWYFLGFALFHMNRGQVATPCFERAALLDPYGSWLSQTLPTLKNTPAGDDDRQVRELLILPETSVSACILTKNSSRTIGRCISALAGAVDEVIVADTGSSDNTVELVRNAHIPVHTFLWEDDFSTARNYAESIATSDWTVAIDSDEILNPEDRELIKTVASMFSEVRSHVVLQTIIENTTNGTVFETEPVARMFPRGRGIQWHHRIHEFPRPPESVPLSDVLSVPVRIRFLHDGYDDTLVNTRTKYKRNLSLLIRELDDYPTDPRLLYFIGREYALLQNFDSAEIYLQKAQDYATQLGHHVLPKINQTLMQVIHAKQRAKQASTQLP
jgi:tetratricopeptide (TPR) repeat protein